MKIGERKHLEGDKTMNDLNELIEQMKELDEAHENLQKQQRQLTKQKIEAVEKNIESVLNPFLNNIFNPIGELFRKYKPEAERMGFLVSGFKLYWKLELPSYEDGSGCNLVSIRSDCSFVHFKQYGGWSGPFGKEGSMKCVNSHFFDFFGTVEQCNKIIEEWKEILVKWCGIIIKTIETSNNELANTIKTLEKEIENASYICKQDDGNLRLFINGVEYKCTKVEE